ncbi:MAG: peptidylprolyl isomerase [Opitutales bacterium]
MNTAQEGNTVQVHYEGKLPDGNVFDSTKERGPLEFTIGSGTVIPGFEKAIVGMKEGESKTEVIAAENAYGPRRDEMVIEVEQEQIPKEIEPEIGQQLQVSTQDGSKVPVKVVDMSEDKIKLDANHPLAGHDLTFELTLVKVA